MKRSINVTERRKDRNGDAADWDVQKKKNWPGVKFKLDFIVFNNLLSYL